MGIVVTGEAVPDPPTVVRGGVQDTARTPLIVVVTPISVMETKVGTVYLLSHAPGRTSVSEDLKRKKIKTNEA